MSLSIKTQKPRLIGGALFSRIKSVLDGVQSAHDLENTAIESDLELAFPLEHGFVDDLLSSMILPVFLATPALISLPSGVLGSQIFAQLAVETLPSAEKSRLRT